MRCAHPGRRRTGDLCPSRARPQAAGPPSGRTTSRGPDRAPGFFDALPCHRQTRTPGAARPTDDQSVGARGFSHSRTTPHRTNLESPVTATLSPELKNDSTDLPTARPIPSTGPAGDRPTRRPARPPHRGRQQAVRRRAEEAAGDRDLARVDAPRARRHPRDPRRQRLRQVDAHPAHLRTADPRRGSGRGLRPRHRPRRDGGQAADQPGQRGRRLLQEAQPDGEPPLRRPPVRPRRQDGASARRSRSWPGWASRRSASTGRSSR